MIENLNRAFWRAVVCHFQQANSKISHFIARKLWLRPSAANLLRLGGWNALRIVELAREGRDYRTIENDGNGLSALLQEWPKPPEELYEELEFPVGMWEISDARVTLNTKFPAVAVGNHFFIHPRSEKGRLQLYPSNRADGHSPVYLQSNDEVLVKRKRKIISLPSAVYVGTRAPHNWSHWLLNFLPGVEIADRYFGNETSPPLIVPPGYRKSESQMTLFDSIWSNREVVMCNPDVEILVDKLHWFEQPVADSPRSLDPANLLPKSLNASALTRFRAKIVSLKGIDLQETDRVRNVFLAREPGRRDYNFEEIHTVASELGCEIVYPNRLSVYDQLTLMNSSRRVVGPIGSAFANILFAGPGAKALVFARPNEDNDWWAPFAAVAGVSMHASYQAGTNSNPWELEVAKFRTVLEEFLN
ncbi:glycosyltransferase family 61 protein [Pontimonas sp.]|nr:glycosyltransferase 61 family protein [Pontimonas sp.]MDA8901177.1 glycosyltransferase family 61 protein [Pontimonas sp.]